jgi:tetratricopeptide (TPR) repeat protein
MADLFDASLRAEIEPRRMPIHAIDLVAMGKLFEDLRHLETAIALYQRGLTCDLPPDVHWATVQRLSFVHKRRGEMLAAVALWRQAAEGGQLYAHLELAKYYEHQARDYRQAADWTQAAMALVEVPGFPRPERRRWTADLEHRLARLQRRLDTP